MTDLHADHLADLRKSGLHDEMIALMRLRSLDAGGLARELGRPINSVQSALVIPYPSFAFQFDDPSASPPFQRYKLFPPGRDKDGRPVRYWQAPDSGVHLYILPAVRAVLTDARVPLYWTEGEKKAAKATQEGFHCVGLGGLWNWTDSKTGKGISELDGIVHVGRIEVIAPDSDVWARPNLLQAVFAFGKELEARGAHVFVVVLPPAGSAKGGLDDYLVAADPDRFRGLPQIELKDKAFTRQREWYSTDLLRGKRVTNVTNATRPACQARRWLSTVRHLPLIRASPA